MNGTYIVEKEFDYTDYANQTIHIDKGVLLSYEAYTNPNMLGMNNSLAIHIINRSGDIIVRGPHIYMPDYLREITQEDMKEIIAYAASRQIEVIPEIAMPGHSNAALSAYPLLACPVVDQYIGAIPGLGADHTNILYCAGNDEVFTFLQPAKA